LLGKPRSATEVINDLDERLVNFWQVVRDDLGALLAALPPVPTVPGYPLSKKSPPAVLRPACDLADAFTREWLGRAKEASARGGSPVERAAALFLLNRCSFAGEGGSPYRSNRVRGGLPEMLGSYNSALRALPGVSARLAGVELLKGPALDAIRSCDGPGALIYADPPFVHSTRTSTDNYGHEMDDGAHAELIEVLDGCRGRVLLEGYWSPLYERLLGPTRWQRYERKVKVSVSAGEKKGDRVQCVWVKQANE
jgi:DNA adenine methylase